MRWDAANGMVNLGSANGRSTRANAISNDGRTIVGWTTDPSGPRQAAKWVDLKEETITGPGPFLGEAHGVNSDGSIIVGDNCDPATEAAPAHHQEHDLPDDDHVRRNHERGGIQAQPFADRVGEVGVGQHPVGHVVAAEIAGGVHLGDGGPEIDDPNQESDQTAGPDG